MDDLKSRALAWIDRKSEALAGRAPLQATIDAIVAVRRECARAGENDLALNLWLAERELWAKLNPRSGDSTIA